MKKKKPIILIIIVVIISFLLFRFTLNLICTFLFNNNINAEWLIKPLYILNINESYIVYYNNGNILYQSERYDEAIELYEESLNRNPPKSRICAIRVNLALAKFSNIQATDKDTVLKKLEEVRKGLYEDGCANEYDSSGKDDNAEELDDEIQKLEKEIKESGTDSNSNNSSNGDDGDEDDTLEKEILEEKKKANSSRQEELIESDYYESYSGYYSGKRW